MDIDIHQTALTISRLTAQNEWFEAAKAVLEPRAIDLLTDNRATPDRVMGKGTGLIRVKTRRRGESIRMGGVMAYRNSTREMPGYEYLEKRHPELYRAVVTRKLPGVPVRSVTLSGRQWKDYRESVKAAVPLPDPAAYRDPWDIAETLDAWWKGQRRPYSETRITRDADGNPLGVGPTKKRIEELRNQMVRALEPGKYEAQRGFAVSVAERGGGEGARMCDWEKLRELDEAVYAQLARVSGGTEVEYLDLSQMHRSGGDVDVRADDAPDSAAASMTGAHPAVHELYRRDL